MRATRWDLQALWRTAALTVLLFAVGCLVTAATDEGGVAWSARLGRTLPLLPACGAMATFLALRLAARRGEVLALETLGCAPARIALPAVLGGASASVAALVLLLALPSARSASTVAAFFPHIGGSPVRVEPGPSFVDPIHRARISADGVVSAVADVPEPTGGGGGLPAGARLSVAVVIAAAGAGLSLVAARRVRDPRASPVLLAAAMCVLCIVSFHFAAAGLASAYLACVPACALLIGAAVRYRRHKWV